MCQHACHALPLARPLTHFLSGLGTHAMMICDYQGGGHSRAHSSVHLRAGTCLLCGGPRAASGAAPAEAQLHVRTQLCWG